jgi:Secretion system C-terminal sorting domain
MRTLHAITTLFIIQVATSQVADTSLNYLPLQIGNTWEYDYATASLGHQYYYTVTVSHDTIAPNKVKYLVLERTDLSDRSTSISLERVDSLTTCVYRYNAADSNSETMVDSLRSKMGNTFGYSTCVTVDQETVLGIQASVKSYHDGLVAGHALAYGLGRISDWQMGAPYDLFSTLVYARINNKEFGTLLNVNENTGKPLTFVLSQNFPNPFNPTTTIHFSLSRTEFMSLEVRNVLGQKVATLASEVMPAGEHTISFNGEMLSSGIYFYTLKTQDRSLTKIMVLNK